MSAPTVMIDAARAKEVVSSPKAFAKKWVVAPLEFHRVRNQAADAEAQIASAYHPKCLMALAAQRRKRRSLHLIVPSASTKCTRTEPERRYVNLPTSAAPIPMYMH